MILVLSAEKSQYQQATNEDHNKTNVTIFQTSYQMKLHKHSFDRGKD